MSDPVYILGIKPWTCWCGPSDTCKVCSAYPISSCEVNWVNGKKYDETSEVQYVSEMCMSCLRKLVARECRIGFLESKGWYAKYGVLSQNQVDSDPRNTDEKVHVDDLPFYCQKISLKLGLEDLGFKFEPWTSDNYETLIGSDTDKATMELQFYQSLYQIALTSKLCAKTANHINQRDLKVTFVPQECPPDTPRKYRYGPLEQWLSPSFTKVVADIVAEKLPHHFDLTSLEIQDYTLNKPLCITHTVNGEGKRNHSRIEFVYRSNGELLYTDTLYKYDFRLYKFYDATGQFVGEILVQIDGEPSIVHSSFDGLSTSNLPLPQVSDDDSLHNLFVLDPKELWKKFHLPSFLFDKVDRQPLCTD